MALKGIKVLELAGLAPAPFCGMILSDFGASVIRVDRPHSFDIDRLARGKRSIVLQLKDPDGKEIFNKLTSSVDVIIDPFRLGVMEKLGLGPSIMLKQNPSLIYARLSGFGHSGPFAKMAGHDINYLSLAGVLSRFKFHDSKPLPPVNLLADFAGGGLMCALGICMALLERTRTGKGQVVDANMVEGSAYIGSFLWATADIKFPIPMWGDEPGKNLLDGGPHFYQTYKTKDGKYVAVGALEPQFYEILVTKLGLSSDDYPQLGDWEQKAKVFQDIFLTKTQKEWSQIFDGSDACVTPVLSLEEAATHPHNLERQSFFKNGHPKPAPRLESSKGEPNLKCPAIGQHTVEVLKEIGIDSKELNRLLENGVIGIDANSKL